MNHRHLSTPWAHRCDLYSPPGSLILKIMLGEAPQAIPTALDVRFGVERAAGRLQIGAVDRVLNHFATRVHITRVYSAATAWRGNGRGRHQFDDLEHALGLSRTFRVNAEHTCCITDLVDALRQLAVVEEAYPHYLSALPFAAPASPANDLDYSWSRAMP